MSCDECGYDYCAHNFSENVNSHRHVNTHSDTIFEDPHHSQHLPEYGELKPSITSLAVNPTYGKMEER